MAKELPGIAKNKYNIVRAFQNKVGFESVDGFTVSLIIGNPPEEHNISFSPSETTDFVVIPNGKPRFHKLPFVSLSNGIEVNITVNGILIESDEKRYIIPYHTDVNYVSYNMGDFPLIQYLKAYQNNTTHYPLNLN